MDKQVHNKEKEIVELFQSPPKVILMLSKGRILEMVKTNLALYEISKR